MTARAWLVRDGSPGTSTVEFAAVVFVFLAAVLGLVDFARALWQWNLAARATQVGVRFAVVSDFAARDLSALDGAALAPIGRAIPPAAVSPNPTVCTADGCGPDVGSTDAALLDAAAFARIVARIRAHHRRIGPDNVVVEYRHVGLGMAGNPRGPDLDPVVTLRLRDLRFEFLGIGFLGLPPIELPDVRASLTAEDGRGR